MSVHAHPNTTFYTFKYHQLYQQKIIGKSSFTYYAQFGGRVKLCLNSNNIIVKTKNILHYTAHEM